MAIEKIAKFLVGVLPDRLALLVVRAIATTQRPPITPVQQQALAQAGTLRYGEGNRLAAWSWGEGPLVILVHGWGGSAAQMAPLAAHIASLGFRCVAIEVTGHGSSPGNRTSWTYFIRDITALTQSLGQEVHAYVAHSAGGLTTMAARGLKGIAAKLYICICAPSHPFPPINVVQKRLNPKPGMMDLYKEFIARQFSTNWATLKSGCSFAKAGPELLLFYDEGDKFVDHKEGDRIHALCPGSQLIKTSSYGHTKVLVAPELMQAVGKFLVGGRVHHDLSSRQGVEHATDNLADKLAATMPVNGGVS